MFLVRNRRILITAAAVALVLILGFALIKNTNAQESGNGLRISPPRVELSVFPGSADQFSIDATNVTTDPLVAQVSVDNFISENEGGAPQLVVDEEFNPPYSIEPFITGLENIPLQSGETKTITVGVEVPVDTPPGGYYGLIRFTAVPEGIEDASGVALSASVGTIVLMEVPGDIVQRMSLVELAAAKSNGTEESKTGSFFNDAPDLSVVRLKNEGNSFLQPFGKVLIKDWSGNTVYEYELNDSDPRGNVLPDTVRRFENNIENISWFGKYTIEANISYGDGGGNIITASSSFWVIPWKLMLLAVAVIAVLIFAGTKGVKVYNDYIVSKSKKNY